MTNVASEHENDISLTEKILRKQFKKWEVVGVFWIVLSGSALHFLYQWTDYSPIIAIFAPVNESVWEYCKLGVWPAVLFSFVQYYFLKYRTSVFITAKCIGIFCYPVVMISLFYMYTFITGKNYLVADIFVFIFSVIISQYVSYFGYLNPVKKRSTYLSARLGVSALILAICIFTYYPPHLPLFEHAGSGNYGFSIYD